MNTPIPNPPPTEAIVPASIKDSGQALRVFEKLPVNTKELLILADSEEHAVGREKAAIQESIMTTVRLTGSLNTPPRPPAPRP